MVTDVEMKILMDLDPDFDPFNEEFLEDEDLKGAEESDMVSISSAIEILDSDRSALVLAARKANRFSVKYPAACKRLIDLMCLQTRALISQVLLSDESDPDLTNVNAMFHQMRLEASLHIRKCHVACAGSRNLSLPVFTRVLDLETEWVKLLIRLENSQRKVNDAAWREKARSVRLGKDAVPAVEAEKDLQPVSGLSGLGSFRALPAFAPLDEGRGQVTGHREQDRGQVTGCRAQERSEVTGLREQEPDDFDDFDDDDVSGYSRHKGFEMFKPFPPMPYDELRRRCIPPDRRS